MRKALVAMSGGVDSSTAAALLCEQGCDVTGVTMRLPRYGPQSECDTSCGGERGIEDARAVARKLGIRHYVLDYREKFKQTVLAEFRSEYLRGRTPNPCVRCNLWLKFGFLLDAARAMEADGIATGHFVRNVRSPDTGRWELRTGAEDDDQSYFLFALSQEQLGRALFPLGEWTKDQVRAKAATLGLPVHDKPGSQGLCFVPDGTYRELLRAQDPGLFRPGPIVHVSGRVLGEHEGIACYTVSQRHGLRVAWDEPLYVVRIEAEANRLIVGEREHLMRRDVTVDAVNWVAVDGLQGPLRCRARVRYRSRLAPATIEPLEAGRVRLTFDEPQLAPTPGQAAVFYDGDCVLGGGFIE